MAQNTRANADFCAHPEDAPNPDWSNWQLMNDIVEKLWEFCHALRHDEHIVAIFEAIRQLMSPPERTQKKIYPVKFGLAAR
jgi:hypothetical protein